MDIPVDTPSDAASSGRWTFVQEVENVHSSKTRRIVRSHAMTAVRKKQRSKEPDTLHSRWPEERLKRLPPKRHRRPETPSSGNDHKLLSMKNPRSPEEEHAFEHKPQPLYSDNLPWVIPGSEYPEEYNTFDQEELDPDIAEEFYESTDTKETRFYDGFPGSSWNATTSFSDPHHRGASQGTFQSGTGVRTILGAGRINPFQMLPVLPSRRIHELIDHCKPRIDTDRHAHSWHIF